MAPFTGAPSRSGLFFDFDGTLAPIVEDPASSRPLPGAADRLAVMQDHFGAVAVISGRPVRFLASHLPAGTVLSGLYGLEEMVDEAVVEHPDAARWRREVERAVAQADLAGLEGVLVEPKGLSLTLHYRSRPVSADAVAALGATIAESTGLVMRGAKASVELHPPIDTDKGRVLTTLVERTGVDRVLYVGDDLGDLPAFAALGELRSAGLATVGVGVVGPETPTDLVRAVDVTVDGPAGVAQLLDLLVTADR